MNIQIKIKFIQNCSQHIKQKTQMCFASMEKKCFVINVMPKFPPTNFLSNKILIEIFLKRDLPLYCVVILKYCASVRKINLSQIFTNHYMVKMCNHISNYTCYTSFQITLKIFNWTGNYCYLDPDREQTWIKNPTSSMN